MTDKYFWGANNVEKTWLDILDIDETVAPFAVMEASLGGVETGFDLTVEASLTFKRHWQVAHASLTSD